MKKACMIMVSPEFKWKLKTESSLNQMSMVEYSRQLAKMPSLNGINAPKLEESERKRFKFGGF